MGIHMPFHHAVKVNSTNSIKKTSIFKACVFRWLVLVLGFTVMPAYAEIFVDIPGVPGESNHAGYEDMIDVLSASGNFSEESCGDFIMAKYLDTSTPALIGSTVTGQVHPTITVAYLRSGSSPYEYLRMLFTNAVITGISTTDGPGPDRATEVVTIKGQSIAIEYTPQNRDGSPGAPVTEMVICSRR